MKVYLEGHLGCQSAGDDAALEAFITLVRDRLGDDVEFTVASRHPSAEFEEAFGVHTVRNLEYPAKEQSRGRWLRGLNPDDDSEILMDYAREIAASDLLVYGAGNSLNQNALGLFKGPLARVAVAIGTAKSVGTPSMLYGMSASALTAELAIAMCDWVLRTADAVVFRERDSIDVLEASGVTIPAGASLLPDPVVLSRVADDGALDRILAAEGIARRSDRAPRLGISVRSLRHLGEERQSAYLAATRSVIGAWTAAGREVVLISQQTYEREAVESDDRVVARELAQASGSPLVRVVEGSYHPWEVEALWSACDVALCTRLHAGVFACKRGVPVVAIAYEPKVSGFWRELGVEEYCLPLEATAETILPRLDAALDEYPREEVARRLAGLASKARQYADVAIDLAGGERAG